MSDVGVSVKGGDGEVLLHDPAACAILLCAQSMTDALTMAADAAIAAGGDAVHLANLAARRTRSPLAPANAPTPKLARGILNMTGLAFESLAHLITCLFDYHSFSPGPAWLSTLSS